MSGAGAGDDGGAAEAVRRREQPPSRSGGGSTGARKASQLGRQMERVISGFQNIFEFEQKISFFQ